MKRYKLIRIAIDDAYYHERHNLEGRIFTRTPDGHYRLGERVIYFMHRTVFAEIKNNRKKIKLLKALQNL
jgi:hypothetical protein